MAQAKVLQLAQRVMESGAMIRARALVAAVPQRVWVAVVGLALLASVGVSLVLGAGLSAFRGAVGPNALPPAVVVTPPSSGVVVVPSHPAAAPRSHPASPPSQPPVQVAPAVPLVGQPPAAPAVTPAPALSPSTPSAGGGQDVELVDVQMRALLPRLAGEPDSVKARGKGHGHGHAYGLVRAAQAHDAHAVRKATHAGKQGRHHHGVRRGHGEAHGHGHGHCSD